MIEPQPAKRQGWDVWLPDTGANEAAAWALHEFSSLDVCWLAAARRHDHIEQRSLLKQMRHVVTRLTQYARVHDREWRARKEAENAGGPNSNAQVRSYPDGLTQVGQIERPKGDGPGDRDGR